MTRLAEKYHIKRLGIIRVMGINRTTRPTLAARGWTFQLAFFNSPIDPGLSGRFFHVFMPISLLGLALRFAAGLFLRLNLFGRRLRTKGTELLAVFSLAVHVARFTLGLASRALAAQSEIAVRRFNLAALRTRFVVHGDLPIFTEKAPQNGYRMTCTQQDSHPRGLIRQDIR